MGVGGPAKASGYKRAYGFPVAAPQPRLYADLATPLNANWNCIFSMARNVLFHNDGSVEFNGKILDDNIHDYAR